ncbi:MAG: hypothetical protein J7604_11475 [Sporocytophaga sp.]|nr:hypothetical protein [Sporocytophaga sp.]
MRNFGRKISHMQPVSNFFYTQIVRSWSDPYGCLRLFDKEYYHKMFVPLSNPALIFPENGFVFSVHEGYQYRFFLCNEKSDPPTYFIEYDPEGKTVDEEPVFSELMCIYINNFIKDHKLLLEQRPDILSAFAEFKTMFLDLLDLLEVLKQYSHSIEDFERVYIFYSSINIYEVFRYRRLELGTYILMEPRGDIDYSLFKMFITKAEDVKNFYRKFFKSTN